MPRDEITYKYVRGQGWVAGYWDDAPRPGFWGTWAKLDFAELERRTLEQLRTMQPPYRSSYNQLAGRLSREEPPRQIPRNPRQDYYIIDEPLSLGMRVHREVEQRLRLTEEDARDLRRAFNTPHEIRTSRFVGDGQRYAYNWLDDDE